MNPKFQIAIDGPVGAGKSSVAKRLANELGFTYIDTGAMYRVATLLSLEANTSNEQEIASLVKRANFKVKWHPELEDGLMKIWVNGKEVTGLIRTKKIDTNVAKIATMPAIRQALVTKQQQIAQNQNIIMEGRDIGLRVLPQADLKVYLDASEKVRVERRLKELRAAGHNPNINGLTKRIKERDQLDKTRKTDPLKPLKDSWILDTSEYSLQEVVNEIANKVAKIKMNPL